MGDRLEREIEEIIREKGDLPQPSPRARRQVRRAERMSRPPSARRFPAGVGQLFLASVGVLLVAALVWDTASRLVGNALVIIAALLFLFALAMLFGKSPAQSYEKRWRGQPLRDIPRMSYRERVRRWWRRRRP